jgi:hypothetical protein
MPSEDLRRSFCRSFCRSFACQALIPNSVFISS